MTFKTTLMNVALNRKIADANVEKANKLVFQARNNPNFSEFKEQIGEAADLLYEASRLLTSNKAMLKKDSRDVLKLMEFIHTVHTNKN